MKYNVNIVYIQADLSISAYGKQVFDLLVLEKNTRTHCTSVQYSKLNSLCKCGVWNINSILTGRGYNFYCFYFFVKFLFIKLYQHLLFIYCNLLINNTKKMFINEYAINILEFLMSYVSFCFALVCGLCGCNNYYVILIIVFLIHIYCY